jgi:drug/metabolite transporter (DMT)-like permease
MTMTTFWNWVLFCVLSIIWGSSFLLMKLGMVALSPYQVAALRILSGGIVLIPFAGKAYMAIPQKKRGLVLASGLLGSFFPAFLFCVAETKINSSVTGMLNSLTPLLTVVMGVVFFQIPTTKQKLIGVVIGLMGLLLLMAPNGHIVINDIPYMLLILLATLLYAINVNLVGKHMQGIASLHIASLAFVLLIVPCLVVLYATHFFSITQTPQLIQSIIAASFLGVAGTAIASVWFYILVKRAGALFASMVTYGIPFVAIIWGMVYGETISLLQLTGLSIILLGVFITNKTPKRI